MARDHADKEATLREVLGEVSLLDVGRAIKSGLAAVGCLLVFLIAVGAATSFGESAGYDMSFGIPDWMIWLGVAWLFAYSATSLTSYHTINASWYFPKLGWLGSLLLAAYVVGFGYLNSWVWKMEMGFERALMGVLVWVGYTTPFLLFLSVIGIGHAKLMEKRGAQKKEGRG